MNLKRFRRFYVYIGGRVPTMKNSSNIQIMTVARFTISTVDLHLLKRLLVPTLERYEVSGPHIVMLT